MTHVHVLTHAGGRYFVDPGLPEREPDREQQSSSGEGLELSIPQVFLAVALGPVVLSTCIRVAIMDPLLFFAQADWANFELTGAWRSSRALVRTSVLDAAVRERGERLTLRLPRALSARREPADRDSGEAGAH